MNKHRLMGQPVKLLKKLGFSRIDRPGEREYQIWIGKKVTALVKAGRVFQVNPKPSPGLFMWGGERK